MNIYVSNLDYKVGSESLTETFAAYGQVSSVNIIVDKFTAQSRGFAFIEMPDQDAAETAIRALDGTLLNGRYINTSVAEKTRRSKRNSFFWYSPHDR